ncbi:discoidin domain-containing protein [Micromonospora sagamiensis]|uniref:F5/8 type C domain-containing protein n=4 Tax=Micromonospora sagamiensis TaxID=47875 RepID=A0A562WH08_9ACTN|nr:discoidin domain-containing protein [Micromonospora sagamiensis]TWJ28844.1 F5/8 type C domain-containing protein [Micromonospora sagamiensis]BCL18129.1 coagulation factor 5/8 type [Micromonospora sagamiensis]
MTVRAIPVRPRTGRRRTLVGLVVALVAALTPTALTPPAQAAATLLSQGRPATASSAENAGTPASAAVDGNTGTRWSSAFSDPQWLQVDLGVRATISQVTLAWEGAYARAFQIQTSDDGSAWTTVWSTTVGTGGTQTLTVNGSGRYVRMYGTARATGYGYSLWEFQVYGETGAAPTCGTTNAAQGRPATASSTENAGTPASAAVDGNTGTRWASVAADPQWLRVDLGVTRSICRVVLTWEAAYARAFQIQTSPDGSAWTTVWSTTAGSGGTQTLTVNGSGRYVRMYGTARATGYGYSLWEFQVHTTDGGTGDPVEPTDPRNPNLGPNTFVFDPATPTATIQSRLDSLFTQQETNQFGPQRYAVLFKPGTYTADVNLGFFTQVAGLGMSPDDVNLNGHVRVEADWFGGNATQNFWRAAENLSVTLPAGVTVERWAVSQAAPYRRMHLRGGQNQIQLWNGGDGWSSGGLMADTRIDGLVVSGSQQQWYSRNSEFGNGWTGSVWNMVFQGVTGAPPPHFPNPSHTVVAQTPQIREKPFLYVDGTGEYRVFVPALRTNSTGTSWYGKTPAGSSISLSQFYVVRPGTGAATINTALAQGRHLLFTPGVHHVTEPIRVDRADTVVLGLGLATIQADNGTVAMRVADVDGVKVAGIMFEAGSTTSPVLMEVGPPGSSADHAANPVSLHDVFFRIGGPGVGRATNTLTVNSDDVIGDHMWLWRADHGDGVGWTVNTADTGLTVNGDDVTMYGLFVEHYQRYQTVWNGNGGRTYFYQNEMPYDPPNQAAWTNGATRGYAAYKVADQVTSHQAWGLGSYCYFNVNPSVVADRAIEAPTNPNVRFTNMVTVSLGGVGTINRVVNTTGGTANTANQVVYLTNYP